ncbi:general stress protein [Kribbella sp. NPDC049174]|uniref:general stress protein n=1 Tax=Kribbella sp. NPDC049174 TaxID=3364112 RepID=UPI003719C29C
MRPDQVSVVPSSVIASVSSIENAQRTVDYLRSYGMDAGSLSIVGADLRQARRRQGVPVVKLTAVGAAQGAVLGLLAGVFVTLVAETSLTGLAVVVWGFVYGGLLGLLWGLFRGLIRNRPDVVATEVVPTRFEVRCPVEELSVARTLLADASDVDDDGRVERQVIADAPQENTEHKDAA